MTRIATVDPAAATGSAAPMLEAVQKGMGMVPNMAQAMATAPAVLKGYLGLNAALSGGVLSAATRESLALAIGEQNECSYCLSAHTQTAPGAGLSTADINAARRGESSDPKIQGALTFARAVNAGRGEVSEADVAAARAAGLSDAELAEVVGAVGLNTLTNFFNKAMATDIEFPVVTPGEFTEDAAA
ncbi:MULTISPECIES: carboxymuconolactone decarboxylase family protein [unclassified Diaminobutyricimonas]|uniref:carboxymuconolactone decarboxylase family protein n=1 Tax=unclassified Diaminobutyricimonas TaxID=2643261 RepID=UPI0012F4B3D7|nr:MULTISPECIES: carboxymuconolactone decarboxylase family protein [unclassified Diaminobutyricimonas]